MGLAKTLILALSIGVLAACSSGSSGNSNNTGGGIFGPAGGNPAPGNHTAAGGTLMGGCAVQVAQAAVANTLICTDFFNNAGGPLTPDKVSQACQQQQGQLQPDGCPTSGVNVTAVCQVPSQQGYVIDIIVYNDNNAADLQKFAASCQQQGGTLNPQN